MRQQESLTIVEVIITLFNRTSICLYRICVRAHDGNLYHSCSALSWRKLGALKSSPIEGYKVR